MSRVLPIPGLQDAAVGFKTVSEAIYLRNQLLSRMDVADSSDDPELRARALTFVFVGGGYAGVEAMAELEDLARFACRYYPRVRREDMRWVLVEAAPRILPEIGEGLGDYALENLRGRDIEVFLSTTLESAEDGVVTLSSGERFAADTLVWTAGVRPAPVVARLGLPVDDRGRIEVDEFLRVRGVEGAWAAGDCAAVPDLVTGGLAPPTAQHALREAKQLARNVAADGAGAPAGRRSGTGRWAGSRRSACTRASPASRASALRGFPAWFLHRSYHVLRVPTMNRKARIVADWTVALFFRRDVVQLGSLRTPRAPFEEAFQANAPPGRCAGGLEPSQAVRRADARRQVVPGARVAPRGHGARAVVVVPGGHVVQAARASRRRSAPGSSTSDALPARAYTDAISGDDRLVPPTCDPAAGAVRVVDRRPGVRVGVGRHVVHAAPAAARCRASWRWPTATTGPCSRSSTPTPTRSTRSRSCTSRRRSG